MLSQISLPEMEETPKIDKVIESFTEKSKIFYQIIILADCLDRLVESENTLGKVKQNVKSFITDFENCIKDFTSHETVLTAYLKGSIDLSKMDIKEDLDKDKKNFEKGESSQTISLRPQTEKAKPIFEKKRDSPRERKRNFKSTFRNYGKIV